MRAIPLGAAAAAAIACLVAAACASAPRAGPGGAGGEAVYRAHCGSCHRLHDPGERTAADWVPQVDRMAARAHLSAADRAAVLDYLQAHAKDAAAPLR